MRVALLATSSEMDLRMLGSSLRSLGVAATVLRAPALPLIERRFDRRGFDRGASRKLLTSLLLRTGSWELVHGFDASSAAVAAAWSRLVGRPSVFTLPAPPTRQWLLARRRRLDYVLEALDGCRAVIAPDKGAADALRWSLGAHAEVIVPSPPKAASAAYARLYRELSD